MYLADFMGFAGIIQDPFGNGRLAGIDMGDYADITYGIDFLFFHRFQPVVIFKELILWQQAGDVKERELNRFWKGKKAKPWKVKDGAMKFQKKI
jgi:hypothetical protein